ncbi:unnamed protein product [Diabrotica balteata]|uniref:Uncharacterized protein n=1 Tax=Diabrotica balteata TaxID=107213 RepID=A0A9N9X8M8_DIABA|nr:unnamed protein product [Diabrotica balteata]
MDIEPAYTPPPKKPEPKPEPKKEAEPELPENKRLAKMKNNRMKKYQRSDKKIKSKQKRAADKEYVNTSDTVIHSKSFNDYSCNCKIK